MKSESGTMNGTPVTMIAAFTIRDAGTYSLAKGFFPLLKKHGGRFLTYDDAAVTLEGTSPGGRIAKRTVSSSPHRGQERFQMIVAGRCC
jgi:hypothetical protein